MSKQIFARYIAIAELLGKMFPDTLEVVIHDFADLDHSIIFIVNGNISGREVGGPATELGLNRLLEQGNIPDLLVNYPNQSLKGIRLKSSSLAIRDDKGKMIGAFCLNFAVEHFEAFQKFLEHFLKTESINFVGEDELRSRSCKEVKEIIHQYLLKNHLQIAHLSYKDKQEIVAYLDAFNAFQIKGAICAAAKELKLTRQSIYNYLKK